MVTVFRVPRIPRLPRRYPVRLSILLLVAVVATTLGIGAGPSAASASPGAPRATASPSTRWTWPLAVPLIQRGYEPPAHRYGAGHRGIDLSATQGETVVSPDDGIVHFAGQVAGRPVLSIDHGAGLISSLEPVDAAVSEGQRVDKGQPIGTVAASDHCNSCLHLGARLDGEYLSPLALLGGVPRAVLLPLE